MGDHAGHPGKPNDITVGGSSWSGASPYNIRNAENAPEVCSANPWPPSTVQIVRRRHRHRHRRHRHRRRRCRRRRRRRRSRDPEGEGERGRNTGREGGR